MNEMSVLGAMRAEVPEPSEADLREAETRFVAALRAPTAEAAGLNRWLAWRGGPATAVAAAAVAVTALAVGAVTVPWADRPTPPTVAGRSPDAASPGAAPPTGIGSDGGLPLRLVSAAQVLDLAAEAVEKAGDQLRPRADQFIVYESTTMYSSFVGDDSRYLYRTKRKLWRSVDGSRTGALRIEHLEPRPYPGWPIPPHAVREVGKVDLLPICAGRGSREQSYQQLRSLPTDPRGMLNYLRSRAGGKRPGNYRVWTAAGDLVRESYLPPAQRAAVYRAMKLVAGVVFLPQAQDAEGRSGTAVGVVDDQSGTRQELVFDARSLQYLGDREFVVDAAKAKAPVGSQLASSAELSVTVADNVPKAPGAPAGRPKGNDRSC